MCLIRLLAMGEGPFYVAIEESRSMPVQSGHCDRNQGPTPGAGGCVDAMDGIAPDHRSAALWSRLLGQVQDLLNARSAHASRSVVLLPYAQLMPVARRAWSVLQPDG